MKKLALLLSSTMIFLFLFSVLALAENECEYARQTLLTLNAHQELPYGDKAYKLELIAVNEGENQATVNVDGTIILIKDGVEKNLSDGNKAAIWGLFASTVASKPDTVWIQIGAATYLDCSADDLCVNPSTIKLTENQVKSYTYSGTNYELNLIAVNDDEYKATVQVNGTTKLFEEGVLKNISDGNKVMVSELHISTVESIPQAATLQFCGGESDTSSENVIEEEQEQPEASLNITSETNAAEPNETPEPEQNLIQPSTNPPAENASQEPEKFIVVQWIDSIISFFRGLFG